MTKKKIIDKLQTPKAVKWFWIILVSPVALIVLLLLLIRLGVFGKLPTFEELENPKSNLATEIYSEDGQMIGSFFVQNRSYVDYSELSPALVAALTSTEDMRFYSHSGIDFISLARVAVKTMALGNRNQGGGSTASKPATKAEIVAYFNKAINGVKPSAKSVTRVSETNYRSGKITGVPSIVDKLVGGIDSFVDGQLKKNSKGSETFSNSAAIKANFPVENESWSSKLTANDVASATCTEAGGVYTITIKTVADKASSNVHHGSGHAPKVFSVVLPSVINDQFSGGVLKSVAKAFKIGTAQMEYPSGTVTVKVDAKTSRVINATYDAKWTIHLPLGDEMVVLPFGTKTIYNIAY